MLLWRQTTAAVCFGEGREETGIEWLLLERIRVKVLFQTVISRAAHTARACLGKSAWLQAKADARQHEPYTCTPERDHQCSWVLQPEHASIGRLLSRDLISCTCSGE